MLWNDTDFQRAVSNTKLSERTIEACRDVLVNGMSGVDAGIKYSIFPAQISRAIKGIRETGIEMPKLVKSMTKSVLAMKSYAIQEAKVEFPSFDVVSDVEPEKVYLGPIVMKTPGYVVQRSGRSLIVHDIGKLKQSPGMGNVLEIEYSKSDELATVTVKAPSVGRDSSGR